MTADDHHHTVRVTRTSASVLSSFATAATISEVVDGVGVVAEVERAI